MELLGVPLLVLLGVVALLVPVATVLLWSRVRGPRLVRAGTRLGMLLMGQLVTVLLVAALANDYGQFYTSWADLFGQSGGPPTVTTYGASKPEAAGRPQLPGEFQVNQRLGPATGRVQVLGTYPWAPPSQSASKGEVLSVRVTGLGSGLSVPAYAYLPPQYLAAAGAHRSFPAVEVLTGYPGSAINLVSRMNYPRIALGLVNAHRIAPMVYVMFSSTVAPPRDTECTNVPHGPQADTFLANELPSAIEHAFRIEPHRWGVVGDSTGGYCAAKLAMFHPGTFAGGISLSGYYYALSDFTTGNLWGGSLAREHDNNLEWVLGHRPAPRANLFVTIGKNEFGTQGYVDTMRFVHLVKPPMRVTALVEQVGGHNFRTWGRELPTALAWLSHLTTAA
jgi:enterochelin esterase-like enzyme